MEALLPKLGPREAVAEVTPAAGTKRRRVGLLLGCVQREFFPQVNAATARVLAAEGCEVVATGDAAVLRSSSGTRRRGSRGGGAGEKDDCGVRTRGRRDVVTNAAGCGSNVKEYGHLLRDDPEYADRAKVFSAKCKDVSEVLAGLEPRSPTPSAQTARGLPRFVPLAACAGRSFAAPCLTLQYSRAGACGNSRGRHLLRLCGNLQPRAARCRE